MLNAKNINIFCKNIIILIVYILIVFVLRKMYNTKTALDRRYSDRVNEYTANLRGLKRQNIQDLALYNKTINSMTSKFKEHNLKNENLKNEDKNENLKNENLKKEFVYYILPESNQNLKFNWVELHAFDVFKTDVEKQGFKCRIEKRGEIIRDNEVLNLFKHQHLALIVS